MAIKHLALSAYAEEAAATGWFYVEPIPNQHLVKQYRLVRTMYYWCRRNDNGTYDVFSGSQHGPYIAAIPEVVMKNNFSSVRENGKLRSATPEETKDIEYRLNWYLSR